jgi:hypothetical protein
METTAEQAETPAAASTPPQRAPGIGERLWAWWKSRRRQTPAEKTEEVYIGRIHRSLERLREAQSEALAMEMAASREGSAASLREIATLVGRGLELRSNLIGCSDDKRLNICADIDAWTFDAEREADRVEGQRRKMAIVLVLALIGFSLSGIWLASVFESEWLDPMAARLTSPGLAGEFRQFFQNSCLTAMLAATLYSAAVALYLPLRRSLPFILVVFLCALPVATAVTVYVMAARETKMQVEILEKAQKTAEGLDQGFEGYQGSIKQFFLALLAPKPPPAPQKRTRNQRPPPQPAANTPTPAGPEMPVKLREDAQKIAADIAGLHMQIKSALDAMTTLSNEGAYLAVFLGVVLLPWVFQVLLFGSGASRKILSRLRS